MNINISAQQFDLTASLQQMIEKKFSKLEKMDPNIKIDIHLFINKPYYHLRAKVTTDKHIFNSEASDSVDMYRCIDLCLLKLEKQFRRSK